MCLGYLKHLNVSRAFKCIALLSGRKLNVSVHRKNYFNDYFVNAILSLRNAVEKQMVAEGFRNVEREREKPPSSKIDDFAGARTSSLYMRKREVCQLIGRVPIFGE